MKTIMHIAQAAGGVERYLYTLLKYSDRNKYQHILVLSQDYDIEKFKAFSNNIECVKMYREIKPLNEIKAVLEVRKLIKKYSPDIVYMHSTKAGIIGRLANIGTDAISIYNPHGWAFNMKCAPVKQNLYANIERLFAHFCTKIIAISEYEKESALKRKVCKSEKIRVIYNGIDFNEFPSDHIYLSKKTLGIPRDKFVIGCVGRLDYQKAPDVFVKAAKLIKKRISNAFFIMVGNGTQQNEIITMIENLGLSNDFMITGWIDNPYDYINCFDIAMLMSRWEGFGLVLPEYMFMRKPIVATRVDAIPYIIEDGKNGLLVKMDDYEAAAEKVVLLYSNPTLYEKLVDNETETVNKRFNVVRVAREQEKLFEELL